MRVLRHMMAAALLGVTAGVQAQTITVTLVNGHPPILRWVKHLQESFVPAVDQALEGSGITIRWRQQYGGTLAKVGEELEAVQDGIADVGLIPSTFHISKLPMHNISSYAPFVSDDLGLVVRAVHETQNKVPAMAKTWEDNGVTFLGGSFGVDDYHLFSKFPINSLEDLKGRKIGTPGPTISWFKGSGAVGVAAAIPEYYNALQTGLFDGVVTFATAAVPAKLHEVAPYITLIGYGAQYTGGLVANTQWYEAQPQALKDALAVGARAYGQAYLDDLSQSAKAALEELVANGVQVNPRSAQIRREYVQAMESPARSWVEELEKQGLPARQVLETYMQEVRAAGAQPLRQWDQE